MYFMLLRLNSLLIDAICKHIQRQMTTKMKGGTVGGGGGGGGQVAEEERMGGWSSKRVGSRRNRG